MRPRNGGLTTLEWKFVDAYFANKYDRAKTEKQLGMHPSSGFRILKRPEVIAEMESRIDVNMRQAKAQAAERLSTSSYDEELLPSQRTRAAIDVIKLQPTDGSDGAGRKAPHEMTPEELQAVVHDMEARRAQLAKVVEAVEDAEVLESRAPAVIEAPRGGIFD